MINVDPKRSKEVFALIEDVFGFLREKHYQLECTREDLIYTYNGEVTDIVIVTSHYESSIYSHVEYQGEEFSLSHIAEFFGLEGLKFRYQFHDCEGLKNGLSVIAGSLKTLLERFDFTNKSISEETFPEISARYNPDPETLKMHQDLFLANKCWANHEYKDVETLLEKWEDKLSPKDRKRLDYVKRVNETHGEEAP